MIDKIIEIDTAKADKKILMMHKNIQLYRPIYAIN